MKKYISIFILSLISFNIAQADKKADVKTPNGSPVIAWIYDETSDAQRESMDNYCRQKHPNAIMIKNGKYSATRTYNCHSYAWHMSEGGDARWIGVGSTAHEDIYMTDGSYIEVLEGTTPRKVSYAQDDHSAITTDQQGWFISKWGSYSLMRHAANDCPYNSNGLKYFIRSSLFTLSGNSVICNGNTAVYSLNYKPAGTITWNVSSGLRIVSGQGTASITVEPTTSAGTQGTVSVSFGTSARKTMSKLIALNSVNVTSITGATKVGLNSQQTYTANPSYWYQNMDWRWEVATSVYPKPSYTSINSQLTITFTNAGAYTLRCWVQTPCGNGGTGYLYVTVGQYYSAQLDPQTGLLTITTNDDFIADSRLSNNASASCTYELINAAKGVNILKGNFKHENGVSTYVNNLSKGVYVLRITGENGVIETFKFNY